MSGRVASLLLAAALSAATAWAAVLAWRGLVEEPYRFTAPAMTAAVLVAAIGAGLRVLRAPWGLVTAVQVVVLLSWLQHRRGTDVVLGGWLPTPHGIAGLADEIRDGAAAIDRYAAPVEQVHSQAPVYLLFVALLLLVAVDTLACGLRRVPWAGLPVLVALTVPISVLDGPLSWGVFITVGVLYFLLLATVEADRTLAWGAVVTGEHRRGGEPDSDLPGRVGAIAPAVQIGAATALVALVLPAFVPVGASVLERGGSGGDGNGDGGAPVVLSNPMVDLRRDLFRQDHRPLLSVATDDRDPSYLRLSVLDVFTGSRWEPSERNLGSAIPADGPLPDPDGITPLTDGTTSTWNLRTEPDFATRWLPTPYVTQAISVGRGDWRYLRDTNDILNADDETPSGVSYAVSAFVPEFDPAALDAAAPAPAPVRTPMTKVPGLTPTVRRIAQQVTARGTTDYAKMVALQRWFRNDGGFLYSLDQRPGDGMRQLERFLTVDKVGYCEQYAAAMAVMARALGIPSRVVVGFLSPDDVEDGTYRYTSDDLHAWPEIYFRGSGWVRFEPTPSARTGRAPSWTTVDGQAPVEPTPTATPSLATPTPAPAPDRRADPQQATGAGDSGSSRWPVLGALVLVLGLLGAAPALVRRAQRRGRLRERADARQEVEALWAELRATALDLGIDWPAGRTAREVAAQLVRRCGAVPDDAAALGRLVTLVERARYSRGLALTGPERTDARTVVERWSLLLAEAQSSRRVRRARMFPRSVLVRVAGDPTTVPEADRSADLAGTR